MYEQERPFDYPGSQSEEHFEVAIVLGSFKVDAESGESFDQYTLYNFSDLADEAEIAEYVQAHHPSYHCQHEYDCCGHFYPCNAVWSFASRLDRYTSATQTVIVKQGFHCNI